MANTYLQRTESAGSRTTFTWSAWVKRSKINSSQFLAACSYSSSDEAYFFFNGGNKLIWQSSSASYGDVQTNRLFRDTNAWYHIVLAFDTTQATASNRIRFYVNGVEETSFSNASYPNQNTQVYWNVGGTYYPRIGRRHATSDYFDGVMSHVAHIDGTQELPTIFGEYDANGVWKIKTTITPSSGWGTNGYHILKDGNSVTDQSGQGNNWTVSGGTLTNTEDNPSNVFATLNALYGNGSYTFEHGNNSLEGNFTNNWGITVPATLGASSGKYYWEVRQVTGAHSNYNLFGFIQTDYSYTGSNLISTEYLNGIQTHADPTVGVYNGTNAVTYLKIGGSQISVSDNDIVSFALDLDNQKGWVAKNGVWCDDLSGNAGNPTTGANALWTSSVIPSGQIYSPVSIQFYDPKCQYNFGNGYFGTTAVTDAGINLSGNGIFEFDVPTGFTALSTKGLNL